MVNKDTVRKQEEQLDTMAREVETTDGEYQEEQLLNLQLSNEHNTLITNLSHVLNQRNSLLLECEGLKDTISILNAQIQSVVSSATTEQSLRNGSRGLSPSKPWNRSVRNVGKKSSLIRSFQRDRCGRERALFGNREGSSTE